jgi:DNA-binding MarR family transcriptional regulator
MADSPLTFFLSLSRAHAMASRRFDAVLGGLHGLGLGDLHLLTALDDAPERKLRRVDLARELGVTPSGVTWMLRPLTKRRLVTSAPSTDDARVTFAVLTEAGHRLVSDARVSGRELAADLLAAHGKQELSHTGAVLARLGGTRG